MYKESIDKISFFKGLSIYDFLEDNLFKDHKVFFFSFHSHWLTEDETLSTPMSYDDIVLNPLSFAEYQKFENNVIDLFKSLYQNNSFFTIITKDDETEEIYAFDSFNELIDTLKKGLYEKEKINIIIPELKVVILSNYDLTFPIYIFSKENSIIDSFKSFNINILE